MAFVKVPVDKGLESFLISESDQNEIGFSGVSVFHLGGKRAVRFGQAGNAEDEIQERLICVIGLDERSAGTTLQGAIDAEAGNGEVVEDCSVSEDVFDDGSL